MVTVFLIIVVIGVCTGSLGSSVYICGVSLMIVLNLGGKRNILESSRHGWPLTSVSQAVSGSLGE